MQAAGQLVHRLHQALTTDIGPAPPGAAGLERREHAPAIDQPEHAGDADPEARIGAHPLAVAGQEIVHQLPDRRTERRPIERLRERAGQRRDDPLIPVVATHHLQGSGEHGRQRPVEQQIAEPGDDVTRGLRRHLGGEPASELPRGHVEIA